MERDLLTNYNWDLDNRVWLIIELEKAWAREEKLVSLATRMLQDDLDNFGHGLVEDWSEELEEELGWGDDCTAVQLGRLLSKDRAKEME